MEDKWTVAAKKADFSGIASELNISPYLVRLMVNRGMTDPEEMRHYLWGTMDDLRSPYAMKDIEKGADIIREVILSGGKIMICGDYDADGVFSSYILKRTITALGGQAYVNIPDRVKEGYGMNMRMAEEAVSSGFSAVVTCDNGIDTREPVKRLMEAGIRVVVTDHHEVPRDDDGKEILPDADAVIDPKQDGCGYPFKGICGCMVAYKLLQVLTDRLSAAGDISILKAQQLMDDLTVYAAIATVTDVMELKDENRIIVREGLKKLAKTKEPGLSAIMDVCSVDREKLSAYHIGFIIGPCFNAAGRLYNAYHAFDLLECRDHEKAFELASKLREMNDERKSLTEQAVKLAEKEIEEHPEIKKDSIFVLLMPPGTHESLAGIIAGRLKEYYSRPVIAFTSVGNGIVKGSGRSIDEYDLMKNLSKYKELFINMGGHAAACGITMKKDDLEELSRRVNEDSPLTEDQLVKKVLIDIPMPVQYMTSEFIRELDMMEPFGKGNKKPLFAESHFNIMKAAVTGRNRNVIRMKVRNTSGHTCDAVLFGEPEKFIRFLTDSFGREECDRVFSGEPNNIDAALSYYPAEDTWNGNTRIQIVIQNYCRISG